jgi:hypothetical protein
MIACLRSRNKTLLFLPPAPEFRIRIAIENTRLLNEKMTGLVNRTRMIKNQIFKFRENECCCGDSRSRIALKRRLTRTGRPARR